MKKILTAKGMMMISLFFGLITGLMLFSFNTMAQANGQAPLDYIEAIKQFYAMFGDFSSIPKYGIPMLVAQFVLLAMKTELGKKAGDYKFLIVSLVTFGIGVMTSLIGGANIGTLIQDGATVSAFSVFIHQLYKRFVK